MNVEIGAEAALFPEKEYINGIAVAVYMYTKETSLTVTQQYFTSALQLPYADKTQSQILMIWLLSRRTYSLPFLSFLRYGGKGGMFIFWFKISNNRKI
jgi:hypothetical protein